MPTRESIIGKLGGERRALLERYKAFSPEDLEKTATQSEAPDGAPWRPKDHLAHLAMIERAFQAMIRRQIAGEKRPVALSGSTMEERIANVHRMNEANVEEHRSDDLDSLLRNLNAARTETLTLLRELTDEQLGIVVPGAPWGGGKIGGILITNAYHERQHVQWVSDGLASA